MSFKTLFLVLALATVVLAEEIIPDVLTAEVSLEASSGFEAAAKEGKNFLLTCHNKPHIPEAQKDKWMWTGDTAFYHDGTLLGEYKTTDISPMTKYHTSSFPEGFNLWPGTDLTTPTAQTNFLSNYSVVVVPKGKDTVHGSFKCSVTIHHGQQKTGEVRFFSEEISVK